MIIVNKIVPKHTKDRQPMIVTEFFLTTGQELMLVGFCSKCHEAVSFVIPLQDLVENCPAEQFSLKDIAELKAMKITLPEPR